MQLATADESNLSNNNPIDEEDIIFLEEAMSDTDDIITATIDNAHPQSIESNVVERLFRLFYWRKICSPFDIPNCSLSGTANLNYEDGHEPKSIEIFSDTIKLEALMNLVSAQSKFYMQQKGMVFTRNAEINEIKAYIGITLFMRYHTLPSICDYWSKDPGLGVKIVSEVMLRDRFFFKYVLHCIL